MNIGSTDVYYESFSCSNSSDSDESEEPNDTIYHCNIADAQLLRDVLGYLPSLHKLILSDIFPASPVTCRTITANSPREHITLDSLHINMPEWDIRDEHQAVSILFNALSAFDAVDKLYLCVTSSRQGVTTYSSALLGDNAAAKHRMPYKLSSLSCDPFHRDRKSVV